MDETRQVLLGPLVILPHRMPGGDVGRDPPVTQGAADEALILNLGQPVGGLHPLAGSGDDRNGREHVLAMPDTDRSAQGIELAGCRLI